MAVNSGLVAYPTSYKLLWQGSGVSLWRPRPPAGYAALGCVAAPGTKPPALTTVVCVHSQASGRAVSTYDYLELTLPAPVATDSALPCVSPRCRARRSCTLGPLG